MNKVEMDEYLESIKFGDSFDQVTRVLQVDGKEVRLCFLASLSTALALNAIVKSITDLQNLDDIENSVINGSFVYFDKLEDALTSLYSGCMMVLIEDAEGCYIAETRDYPTRGISEPDTEKSVRGSKDGFTENIITNVGLLRRRIRETDFVVEKIEANDRSKTLISLCYVEGRVNKKVLDEVRSRIENMEVEMLVMTDRALEESVFRQKFHPFPFVRYTERPDIATSQLIKGYVVILVDTSPSVIICPSNYFDHIGHVEEYRQTPLIGTFLRIIRYGIIAMSLYLVPLWLIAITGDVNPTNFLIAPEAIEETPIFLQIFVAELSIELIRLATIHTPSQLGSAMGVIAAMLLGQMAMDLGMFVPEVLMYSAIANIGHFATPSYELSLANKFVKFGFIIAIAMFGNIGFIVLNFLFFLYMINLKIVGHPYLYPLIPFNFEKLKAVIIRKPYNNKKQRHS